MFFRSPATPVVLQGTTSFLFDGPPITLDLGSCSRVGVVRDQFECLREGSGQRSRPEDEGAGPDPEIR